MSMTHKKKKQKISMMQLLMHKEYQLSVAILPVLNFFPVVFYIHWKKNVTFECTFVARQKIFMHLCISFALDDTHARERNRNSLRISLAGRQSLYIFTSLLLTCKYEQFDKTNYVFLNPTKACLNFNSWNYIFV